MPSDPAKLDFELLVKVQTMRFIINQYNYTETVYFQGYSDFWTCITWSIHLTESLII